METLKLENIFPDNKIKHMEIDLSDGEYCVDNEYCKITVKDKKLMSYTKFYVRGENEGKPHIIFSFDYDTMQMFREFPTDNIKRHVYDSKEIEKGNIWYNNFIKNALNTTMQLQNQVEKVTHDKIKGITIAHLKNGETVHWDGKNREDDEYTKSEYSDDDSTYSAEPYIKYIFGTILVLSGCAIIYRILR